MYAMNWLSSDVDHLFGVQLDIRRHHHRFYFRVWLVHVYRIDISNSFKAPLSGISRTTLDAFVNRSFDLRGGSSREGCSLSSILHGADSAVHSSLLSTKSTMVELEGTRSSRASGAANVANYNQTKRNPNLKCSPPSILKGHSMLPSHDLYRRALWSFSFSCQTFACLQKNARAHF